MAVTRRHALGTAGGLVIALALAPVNDQFSQFLRLAFLRSPNYAAGVTGWTINQDGSAEFNNLTVRGEFEGTTFEIDSSGAFFYSPTAGAGNLIVSIAPAAGNDEYGNAYRQGIAVYNTASTDFANLLTGRLIWGTAGASDTAILRQAAAQLQLTSNGTANKPRWRITSTVAAPTALLALETTVAEICAAAFLTGDVNNRWQMNSDGLTQWGNAVNVVDTQLSRSAISTLLIGDAGSGNKPQLQITGTVAAASSALAKLTTFTAAEAALAAQVSGEANSRVRLDTDTSLRTGPGGAVALDTLMQRLGPAVWGPAAGNGLGLGGGAAPASIAGTGVLYANANGRGRMIDAATLDTFLDSSLTDTGNNTVTQVAFNPLTAAYAIPISAAKVGSVYRLKTSGSATWGSTQQQLTLAVRFAGLDNVQLAIANTAFAINTALHWEAEAEVLVLTTGAGGTAKVKLAIVFTPSALAALLTSSSLAGVKHAASIAFNTTLATTLNLEALWASTTGTPTITGNGSSFERLGP